MTLRLFEPAQSFGSHDYSGYFSDVGKTICSVRTERAPGVLHNSVWRIVLAYAGEITFIMNRLGSFLGGMIIGMAAGTVAALLLAPKSGEDLRDDIKRDVDEILEEGRRAAEQRQREMEEQLNRLRGL